MNTVIYLILFFVVIGLVLFGAFEILPKIHQLNQQVAKDMKLHLGQDKDQLMGYDSQRKSTATITSQYVILAIISTIFVFELFYPEVITNYLLIVMFIIEAYFILTGIKLPKLEKNSQLYSEAALPTRIKAVKWTFFSFIAYLVAIDVLSLILKLLLDQNFKLL